MPKKITPAELAEIVNGLLVDPQAMGVTHNDDTYSAFMLDVGAAVARHYGGKTDIDTSETSAPKLVVYSNDDLPSLNNNVWSPYDPAGWQDIEFLDLAPPGIPLTQQQIDQRRHRCRTCLVQMPGTPGSAASPVSPQPVAQNEFVLDDVAGDAPPITGFMVNEGAGLALYFAGHTDFSSDDDAGAPVLIENNNGQAIVYIWSDVNHENPAHYVTLQYARNEYREEEAG